VATFSPFLTGFRVDAVPVRIKEAPQLSASDDFAELLERLAAVEEH
jgi:hypothetical protein